MKPVLLPRGGMTVQISVQQGAHDVIALMQAHHGDEHVPAPVLHPLQDKHRIAQTPVLLEGNEVGAQAPVPQGNLDMMVLIQEQKVNQLRQQVSLLLPFVQFDVPVFP